MMNVNFNGPLTGTRFTGQQRVQKPHVPVQTKSGSAQITFGEGFSDRLLKLFLPGVYDKRKQAEKTVTGSAKGIASFVGDVMAETIPAKKVAGKKAKVAPLPSMAPVKMPEQHKLNVLA
jgi:flagellar hook-basal body complex protein FliE